MRGLLPLLLLLALPAVSGCASTTASTRGPIQVVAAESIWGSIAAQLGGSRVHVTSVVSSPATDPHDYEPTAADGRLLAGARLAIVNGIGYDAWASKLLSSSPVSGRVVLDVGDLLGLAPGDNPHQWYSPESVDRVITAVAGDYARLDPRHAAYFRARRRAFETGGLAPYRRVLAEIRRRYRGTAVGASESIFAPLAQALGLKLLTPGSFLNAISEGTEPTASDITTLDRQVARREIEVWVVNSQNSTPDVKRITDAARRQGIPVVTITETPTPASARFQDWQVRQLEALARALAKATGR